MMMESMNQLSAHCVSGFLLSFLTMSICFSINSSQQHNIIKKREIKMPKCSSTAKSLLFSKKEKRRLYEKPNAEGYM
jgi:hypothetical protein